MAKDFKDIAHNLVKGISGPKQIAQTSCLLLVIGQMRLSDLTTVN